MKWKNIKNVIKPNWSNWKLVGVTESLGWVTVTQCRKNYDTGLTQFKNERFWVNTDPKSLEELKIKLKQSFNN